MALSKLDQDLIDANTVEQMRALLNAGADVHAKNSSGRTALMCAQTVEQTELLRDVIDKEASPQVIRLTAPKGSTVVVDYI